MSSAIAVSGSKRPRVSPAVGALVLLSLPIALYGLAFSLQGALLNPQLGPKLLSHPWIAVPHFAGGGIALLIGGVQFSAWLRETHPRWHRWIGRTYLSAVAIGGVGGLGIATISYGGWPTHIGFGLLALLWLASAGLAYVRVRAGDIAGHRRWMTRNFALTFAAVTLRIELPLLIGGCGLSFEEAYITVAWLAWVPNLLFVDWWLNRDPTRTIDSSLVHQVQHR